MNTQAQTVEKTAYRKYCKAASAEVRVYKRILPAAVDMSQDSEKIMLAWKRAMASREKAWDEYMVAAEAARI